MSRDRAVNKQTRAWALLLAAALLALGACTGQFLYNRLDFIIPFYVSQRVTLADPQEDHLKAAVREMTSWHRSSQLTRYSAFLRELARKSEQPTTREELEAAARTMEEFWFDVVREALPEGSAWLRSLTREQVEELAQSYEEEDAKDREKYCEAPLEKRVERRIKTMKKSVRRWSGTLDDGQTTIVERSARAMRPTGCQWLDNRQRWRAELKTALFEVKDPAESEKRIRALMLEPESIWSEDYRRDFAVNRELLIDMMVQLDGTWSEKQRRHIVERLNEIAEDLEELAS
ncbi:MAG TPA: DUF6279 family lipoprotein [Steroidobacteraceae bacterium]|nr:DUF6279 family lipoprotein [Steroidobacteraceae bacterium]